MATDSELDIVKIPSSYAPQPLINFNAVESSTMNVGAGEKPAWNKPSSGVPLVRSDSWPSLSEAARASPTPSSVDINDLWTNEPQEVAVGSDHAEVATSVTSPTPYSPSGFTRQTSVKLDGASSSDQSSKTVDGSLCQAPKSVQTVVVGTLPPNRANLGVSIGEPSRENTHSKPIFQGNNGGRREHEYKRHNLANHHRSFGGRGNNGPQQRFGTGPFIRGPPPQAPFIPHPPHPGAVGPYLYPMVYPEVPPHMPYPRGLHPVPFGPPPMVPFAPFNPIQDFELPSKIVKQVDYYFSYDNLVKDTYLRGKMDENGWVPITLIAGFQMIMRLTSDIQLITNALQGSNVVEVKGDKLRLRNDWNRWILTSLPRSS